MNKGICVELLRACRRVCLCPLVVLQIWTRKSRELLMRRLNDDDHPIGFSRYDTYDSILSIALYWIIFYVISVQGMLLGTGIQALRVNTADAATQVDAVSRAFYKSALDGNPYIALTSTAEFQELQPTSTYKVSEYFLALQSLDNILLSTHGIENAGAFEKKSHVLEKNAG